MELKLYRQISAKNETLSSLFDLTPDGLMFLCYVLENGYRKEKIPKETRIPPGVFEIKLRTTGGFHGRYTEKFPKLHKGMLELQEVPGFRYILIHIGNTAKDTDGCLLVGNQSVFIPEGGSHILNSARCYRRVYEHIIKGLEKERVFIDVDSVDRFSDSS